MKIQVITIDVTEHDTNAMLAAAQALISALSSTPQLSVKALEIAQLDQPDELPALPPVVRKQTPARKSVTKAEPPKAEAAKAATVENPPKVLPANGLPFEQFDELVRKEMRRLSSSGAMPGPALWNEQRDQRLPHLAGVMDRYQCSSLSDLAKILGMATPLMAATQANGTKR